MKMRWTPARDGDALHEVDTPALVLDLDRFEANLERLMRSSTVRGTRVRPHAKSHKCVEIARRQMAAGAVGICCQKVSEAEVFLAGGIEDVLVSNEIIGKRKVTALASLAVRHPKAKIGVCVEYQTPRPSSTSRARSSCTETCGCADCRPTMARRSTVAQCANDARRSRSPPGLPARRATVCWRKASAATSSPAAAPAPFRMKPAAVSTTKCSRARTC